MKQNISRGVKLKGGLLAAVALLINLLFPMGLPQTSLENRTLL